MDKKIDEAARELGRKGGLATKKKHGKAYYKELSKKMLEARWGKKEESEDPEKPLDKEEK